MEIVYVVYLRTYDDILADTEGSVMGIHTNRESAENQGKLMTHMTGTNFLPSKYVIKEFKVYEEYDYGDLEMDSLHVEESKC